MSNRRPNHGTTPSGTLPEETLPHLPEASFVVADAVAEMNAATQDSAWFCSLMDRAEKTRLCEWAGKTGTGRKDETRASQAKPWPGAADHEVHLVQELLDERNAARVAALARGALSVWPMDSTDAAKAGLMKTVINYYLTTAMKSQMLVHGMRAGSWADRFGHALLYIGWKEERAVERKTITLGRLVEVAVEQQFALSGQTAEEMPPEMARQIVIQSEDMVMMALLDPLREEQAAGLLLAADEGLRQRGRAGVAEARRAIRQFRKLGEVGQGMEAEVSYISSYVKSSAPCWESLRPFVDVFYPAETVMEDNLDGARWIARVRRLSAQQLREQAVIHDWDAAWVEEVIETQRGKQSGFNERLGTPWALNGLGTRWRQRMASGTDSGTGYGETQKHLFEIVEMWDRSTTPDGLTGTYHTVFHSKVPEKIAKRKLLEYWSGCYPFVPFTSEKDELMLLDSRGLPERLKGDQDAIKVQWDSRTNAASLTTLPIWTGPAELRNTVVRPGSFLESYRMGEVSALQLPPPDGRSVEIEKTIRANVARRFGRMDDTVPQPLSMLMGQADMDWFLNGVSQAVALTARLVQQFMPPLKGARITGTQESFDATADDVRGSYDFTVSFDVRGLDIEWAKEMLTFVKDLLLPMDRRGQINTGPLIEFGMNILSPSLATRSLIPMEEANRKETTEEKVSLTDIFSGGAGQEVQEGMDHEERAKIMVSEFQRSPLRQQMVATVPQIREVFTSRLKQLVASVQQYQENAIIGQNMGQVPLKPQSEAEMLLAQLEQLPEAA